MPLFPPNVAYGRVASVWREWATPWVHRSGSWVNPELVWVYSAGSWRIVWAETATPAVNPLAVLQGDDTVDITWDAPAGSTADPEVATSYNVRRFDNSLVGSVSAAGGSYSVTDSTPFAGTHAYTIFSLIDGVQSTSINTNTVTVAPAPTGIVAVRDGSGPSSIIDLVWNDSPGAATYNVYRPDSTFIGSTAGLAFQDTDPQPGVGGYIVLALALGGSVGGSGVSNVLTLAGPPTSLTASAPASGDDVTLAWSLALVGDHDQIQVVRGGVSLAYLSAPSFGYVDTNAREGTVESYQVRALIAGNPGPYSNTATSSIPANVPTVVTAVPTATLGQLSLTWGNPAGSYTGYQVQRDDGGWADVGDNTSPALYTWAAGSGTRSMRVRTLSDGGASAYVTVSATPTWDNTPPAVPTITGWKPEASYGRMVLRFTTSSSDNFQYRITILTNGFPSYGAWTSVGNSASVSFVAGTFAEGQIASCNVEVRDQYYNTSAGVGGDYTIKPYQQNVFANSSGNFRQGAWNSYTGDSRPYQGYFSNPSFIYTGLYFFATNAIYNAIQATSTFGGTVTVQSMTALVARVPGIGNSIQTVYMGTSATVSASGTPSVQNIVAYPNLSTSSTYQPAFNAAAIAAFSNGTAKSVGFYVNSTAYSAFYMPSENVFAGFVQITSLG